MPHTHKGRSYRSSSEGTDPLWITCHCQVRALLAVFKGSVTTSPLARHPPGIVAYRRVASASMPSIPGPASGLQYPERTSPSWFSFPVNPLLSTQLGHVFCFPQVGFDMSRLVVRVRFFDVRLCLSLKACVRMPCSSLSAMLPELHPLFAKVFTRGQILQESPLFACNMLRSFHPHHSWR